MDLEKDKPLRYTIYAIGDALIDLEFEVTDQQLKSLNIKKGETTYLDDSKLQHLMASLPTPPKVRASGGSVSNTIMTIQLLGANNFSSNYYCGIVADDEDGEFIFQDFNLKNIDTNLAKINRQPGITGKCIVLLTPDGERSLCTYKGICANLSTNELNLQALRNSEFLYTEGFLVTCPATFLVAKAAHRLAKQEGKKRVLGLSDPNIVQQYKNNFLQLMEDPVDLLFCNEKEAYLFCDTFDFELVKKILPQFTKTFAITLDARGSVVFDGNAIHHAQARPVKMQNSLGAGDAFAGAFLYALSAGYSFPKANELANLVAGRVVTKYGPKINKNDAVEILEEWHSLPHIKS